MTDTLVGYDMVLAISQNEVNSQFSRMASGSAPVIDTWLTANGVSTGWGGIYTLSNYLRGYVDAPTVQFYDPAAPDSHDHVFFQITFATHTLTQDDLTRLGIDPSRVIFPAKPEMDDGQPVLHDGQPVLIENTTDGFVEVLEDVAVTSNPGQTLSNQSVYYWLRVAGQVGTTTTWELVPVTYFYSDGQYALVDLTGLQMSFKVMLSMIPTTPDALQALVDDGLMDPSALSAINDLGFNADIFSLQQLFLNFDTVDFTEWTLTAPAGTTEVNVTLVDPKVLLSQSLDDLVFGNPDFRTAFSTTLRYVFGVDGQNQDGRTPYILGINAASKDPGQSDPQAEPSLVPTWIGYGATSNPDNAGWSTINYQLLGGPDPDSRVPRTGDGATKYVTTPMVSSDDYSGTLAFAKDEFFTPFVLEPIQEAVGIKGTWSQSGMTFSVRDQVNGKTIYDTGDTYVIFGEGEHGVVTKDYDYRCTITIDGNTISLSGSLYQRQDYNVYTVFLTKDTIRFHWWYYAKITFSQTITMSVDSNNQLIFTASAMQTSTDGPHKDENFGGSIVSGVTEVFSFLLGCVPSVSDIMTQSMNAMTSQMTSQVAHMNSNLTSGMAKNFISPTGGVFLMNGPRFDDALDLFMDVTYRV